MICGKEHKDLDAYAACVSSCNAQVKAEQKKQKEEQLNREKNDRLAKIHSMYEDINKEISAFRRDYGYYSMSRFDPISRLVEFL